MKQGMRRTLMVFIFSLFFLNTVSATSIMTSNCPDKFVGKVITVRDSKAPSLSKSLMRLDVSFLDEGNQTLKKIKVLKFGPTKFKKGQKFYVEMNHGLICNLQKI